ncbi:MAG: UDP-N-acetylmuramoyl-tripeptide--D-alanyl-D-alanine ligase, partial [Anaerolineae bacterium]
MIRLGDLVRATGGVLATGKHEAVMRDFCYDSRLAEPGQLFVAVVTDTGDGHEYIGDAIGKGVTGVMCQRMPEGPRVDSVAWLVVDDTQRALLDYAAWVLADRQVEVVGITGSVGKTSTKEAIAAVLGRREPVFRNQGSYNGRYGLPIALGRLGSQKLAVLEMASDSLDEIRDLALLARPRVGVVTSVGHSHVADLGGLASIAVEKGRLIESLPRTGLAVLNGDDVHVRAMHDLGSARVITVGLSPDDDIWADGVETSLTGTACTVHDGGLETKLYIPWLGQHHAYTMLFAYALGREYRLSPVEIAQGLLDLDALPGRLNPLDGREGSLILDDSFNASPESFEAALDALQSVTAKRRWVVMGDMADLGPEAEALHRSTGRLVSEVADRLVAKGELAAAAAEEALRAGMPPDAVRVSYADSDIVSAVAEQLAPGDVLLVKGSASSRMEEVVKGLMADPGAARDTLVRQDRGWQSVQLRRPGRPTWVEIDLDAIARNTRLTMEKLAPGVELMAVLKADAYGHGARKVAQTVIHNGATWLGVACLGEGVELRRAGIDVPILNLGFTPAWHAREAVRNDIASTVYSLDVAQALARAGRDLGREALVHVKVDTGMGRLGLLPSEIIAFLRQLHDLKGLDVQG